VLLEPLKRAVEASLMAPQTAPKCTLSFGGYAAAFASMSNRARHVLEPVYGLCDGASQIFGSSAINVPLG
jgi:hypothetical protein